MPVDCKPTGVKQLGCIKCDPLADMPECCGQLSHDRHYGFHFRAAISGCFFVVPGRYDLITHDQPECGHVKVLPGRTRPPLGDA